MTVSEIHSLRRQLLFASAVLFILGLAVCDFGIQHEIGKIPADVRARMGDTDWVGTEWALRSVLIDALALAAFVMGCVLWFIERRASPERGL